MRYHTHQVDAETVERVTRHGRDYLEFPIVPLREMVLDYPEFGTSEYLPADAIERSAPMWAGAPLVHRHPPNRGNGQTARDPDAYLDDVFGQFHEPTTLQNGAKLRGKGVIDVDKANAIGGPAADVVALMEDGQTVSVSSGYGTVDDRRRAGSFEGTEYDLVQGGLVPDHIAVFPSDEHQARCAPDDGCAAPRVNAHTEQTLATPLPGTDEAGAAGADGSGGAMRTNEQGDNVTDADDQDQTHDQDDPARSLGRRVGDALTRELRRMNFTAASPDADADADVDDHDHDHDHEDCGCDGACDECADRTNTADGAGSDPDGTGDSQPDDTDPDSMTDDNTDNDNPPERAQRLAEQTAFGADTLADWDDESLDNLEATLDAQQADVDDQDQTQDGPTATDADAGGQAQEVTVNTDELASAVAAELGVDDLRDEVAEVKEKVNSQADQERARKVEIVANATDLSEDGARALPDEELDRLADEHGQPRANYGAVPGTMDRSVDDGDDYENISAGTRSDYEARKNGGD